MQTLMTPKGREARERYEEARKQERPRCIGCGATLRSLRKGAKEGYCDPCARKKGEVKPPPLGKTPTGRKIKRFCVQGHDTEKVGRNRHGRCRECIRESMRRANEKRLGKAMRELVELPNLQIVRKSKGFATAISLAERVGLEASRVRRYESGASKAPKEKAKRIARALGVPLKELTG